MFEKDVLEVYKKCNVRGYPFDCINVLKCYGYDVKTYIEASKSSDELRRLRTYSHDAFTDYKKRIIYYNDAVSRHRIRFSLMHELGHIILKTEDDLRANIFAGEVLAPPPLVYSLGLKTATRISEYFDISIAAANIAVVSCVYSPLLDEEKAIMDYFRAIWFRWTAKKSSPEKEEEQKPALNPIPLTEKEERRAKRALQRALRGRKKEREELKARSSFFQSMYDSDPVAYESMILGQSDW